MVRPNHDIPHKLLGAVRDYAEKQDISSEEGHKRLLRMALVAVGELPDAVLSDENWGDDIQWPPDTFEGDGDSDNET